MVRKFSFSRGSLLYLPAFIFNEEVNTPLHLMVQEGESHWNQQTFLVIQNVFSVTFFVFQDVSKTSSRRLQGVFAIRLPETSSRRLARRLQDVFKTSAKTSSRRVWKTSCNYFFKTSSRRLGRQTNVTLKTSLVRLHQEECLLGRGVFAQVELWAYFNIYCKEAVHYTGVLLK